MTVRLHSATFAELDAATLYALLRLRVDVFVVEQRCPYPELDGRDTEPDTRHLWLTEAGAGSGVGGEWTGGGRSAAGAGDGGGRARGGPPLAYLRIVHDPEGPRIGRVVTAPCHRGTGLAGRLMEAALDMVGDDRPVRLAAQVRLAPFYARYGFVVAGPGFVEDGIAHLPMLRPATGHHR